MSLSRNVTVPSASSTFSRPRFSVRAAAPACPAAAPQSGPIPADQPAPFEVPQPLAHALPRRPYQPRKLRLRQPRRAPGPSAGGAGASARRRSTLARRPGTSRNAASSSSWASRRSRWASTPSSRSRARGAPPARAGTPPGRAAARSLARRRRRRPSAAAHPAGPARRRLPRTELREDGLLTLRGGESQSDPPALHDAQGGPRVAAEKDDLPASVTPRPERAGQIGQLLGRELGKERHPRQARSVHHHLRRTDPTSAIVGPTRRTRNRLRSQLAERPV